MDFLQRTAWNLLDLVFPPSCPGCGKSGKRFCEACINSSRRVAIPICKICGEPLLVGDVCHRCLKVQPTFKIVRSWGIFEGPLRKGIHRLKYKNDIGLGSIFAELLFNMLDDLSWDIDIIMAVPLGKKRIKERGYNQAVLIAKPLSKLTGIPYSENLITRIKETKSQVGMSVPERKENMKDAFYAKPNINFGKSILIIDDVFTSGSTMESCSKALKSVGANEIFGLTIARTMLK